MSRGKVIIATPTNAGNLHTRTLRDADIEALENLYAQQATLYLAMCCTDIATNREAFMELVRKREELQAQIHALLADNIEVA